MDDSLLTWAAFKAIVSEFVSGAGRLCGGGTQHRAQGTVAIFGSHLPLVPLGGMGTDV